MEAVSKKQIKNNIVVFWHVTKNKDHATKGNQPGVQIERDASETLKKIKWADRRHRPNLLSKELNIANLMGISYIS